VTGRIRASRARYDHLAAWYKSLSNRGVVDPVDIDNIIEQVFAAWLSDLTHYEFLCSLTQQLSPAAKGELADLIAKASQEDPDGQSLFRHGG